jgi:hypothetical protein
VRVVLQNHPIGEHVRSAASDPATTVRAVTEHRPPGSFSPELALVDPEAAERERGDLPDVELTEDAAPRRGAEATWDARRRARAPWVIACVVVLAAAGLAMGVRLGFRGAAGEPTAPTHAGASAARAIPDFVWVPAAGASRYRVEFVRGGQVVLRRTTAVPRLHLAASLLPPGRYRWRVYALGADGAPLGSALVDAAVDIG